MNMNEEIAVWREQWQSAPAAPIDLIQRVERQTERMRMLRAAEIVVTIVMGGAVLAGAIVHPVLDRSLWLTLAAGTWLFTAALWIVSIRSTRRVWEPAEYTTAGYVSLRVQKLRRELERTLLGTIVTVLLSVFVLSVAYEGLAQSLASHGVQPGPSDYAVFWIVGGIVNVFVVLGQLARRAKTKAELMRMTEIKRGVETSSDGSTSVETGRSN